MASVSVIASTNKDLPLQLFLSAAYHGRNLCLVNEVVVQGKLVPNWSELTVLVCC